MTNLPVDVIGYIGQYTNMDKVITHDHKWNLSRDKLSVVYKNYNPDVSRPSDKDIDLMYDYFVSGNKILFTIDDSDDEYSYSKEATSNYGKIAKLITDGISYKPFILAVFCGYGSIHMLGHFYEIAYYFDNKSWIDTTNEILEPLLKKLMSYHEGCHYNVLNDCMVSWLQEHLSNDYNVQPKQIRIKEHFNYIFTKDFLEEPFANCNHPLNTIYSGRSGYVSIESFITFYCITLQDNDLLTKWITFYMKINFEDTDLAYISQANIHVIQNAFSHIDEISGDIQLQLIVLEGIVYRTVMKGNCIRTEETDHSSIKISLICYNQKDKTMWNHIKTSNSGIISVYYILEYAYLPISELESRIIDIYDTTDIVFDDLPLYITQLKSSRKYDVKDVPIVVKLTFYPIIKGKASTEQNKNIHLNIAKYYINLIIDNDFTDEEIHYMFEALNVLPKESSDVIKNLMSAIINSSERKKSNEILQPYLPESPQHIDVNELDLDYRVCTYY